MQQRRKAKTSLATDPPTVSQSVSSLYSTPSCCQPLRRNKLITLTTLCLVYPSFPFFSITALIPNDHQLPGLSKLCSKTLQTLPSCSAFPQSSEIRRLLLPGSSTSKPQPHIFLAFVSCRRALRKHLTSPSPPLGVIFFGWWFFNPETHSRGKRERWEWELEPIQRRIHLPLACFGTSRNKKCDKTARNPPFSALVSNSSQLFLIPFCFRFVRSYPSFFFLIVRWCGLEEFKWHLVVCSLKRL